MLRFLIGSGLLLMLVGFGAAGWQYWQLRTPPVAATSAAPDAAASSAAQHAVVRETRQSWLISPTGGMVPQEDVATYLAQDRFAPGRRVVVTRQARLADLLAEGEALPEVEYLQVLADIRAPRVAEGLCAVVLQSGAVECAVNAARVVAGSVDPVAGTAMFRLELVFRLPEPADGLPDLAAHVLRTELLPQTIEPGAPGSAAPEAALQSVLATANAACAGDGTGKVCRLMDLSLDWVPRQPVAATARIAWLDPLPAGLFAAPPLSSGDGD